MADTLAAAARVALGVDLEAVLTEIAGAARAAFGAERATCYAYDVPSQTVAAAYTTEQDPARRGVLERAIGRGPDTLPIWRLQIADGDDPLLVIEDMRSDPRVPEPLARALGAGAVIGARLEHEAVRGHGTTLLGALFVSFAGPRRVSRRERDAARGIAGMASLALANAFLQVAAARLEAEQAALRRVATAVATAEAAGDPALAHAATAREAVSLLPADAAVVVRWVRGRAAVVGAAGARFEVGGELPVDGEGALAGVQRSGRTHAVADYSRLPADSAVRRHALDRGYRSGLAVPVRVGGSPWGAVAVFSRRPGGIPPDAGERLERFTELSALAISGAEARAELVREATRDPLTGLANRRVFFTRLREACDDAGRHGRALSLIVVDLDDFKSVNDRHGHLVGDRVLVEFAGRLRAAVRAHDTLARTGGEEFAWLLPGSDRHAAHAAAERLREGVRARAFADAGRVTVSAGVAERGAGDDAQALFAAADAALYRAKRAGRDATRAAGPLSADGDGG